MIAFLRLAGLGTAAVWLGGTVLFLFVVDPLFGRAELLRLLGPLYAGEAGLQMAERFQMFQVICASAALILTLGDWLYTGRPLDPRLVVTVVVLLLLGSLGRLWLTPKCRELNLRSYLGPNRQALRQAFTPAQREAEHALAVWQGVGVVFHVIALAGAGFYMFRAAAPGAGGPRLFSTSNRLRI